MTGSNSEFQLGTGQQEVQESHWQRGQTHLVFLWLEPIVSGELRLEVHGNDCYHVSVAPGMDDWGRKEMKKRQAQKDRTRLRGPKFSDGEAAAALKLSVFII